MALQPNNKVLVPSPLPARPKLVPKPISKRVPSSVPRFPTNPPRTNSAPPVVQPPVVKPSNILTNPQLFNSVAHAEVGSFKDPWVRTTSAPKAGSSAFGPAQLTGSLATDIVRNAKKYKLTPQELLAMQQVVSQSKLFNRNGTSKYFPTKPKGYNKAFDYGGKGNYPKSSQPHYITAVQKVMGDMYKTRGNSLDSFLTRWRGVGPKEDTRYYNAVREYLKRKKQVKGAHPWVNNQKVNQNMKYAKLIPNSVTSIRPIELGMDKRTKGLEEDIAEFLDMHQDRPKGNYKYATWKAAYVKVTTSADGKDEYKRKRTYIGENSKLNSNQINKLIHGIEQRSGIDLDKMPVLSNKSQWGRDMGRYFIPKTLRQLPSRAWRNLWPATTLLSRGSYGLVDVAMAMASAGASPDDMYNPQFGTVSAGVGRKGALAHEIGHWVDLEKNKSQIPRRAFKGRINTITGSASSTLNKELAATLFALKSVAPSERKSVRNQLSPALATYIHSKDVVAPSRTFGEWLTFKKKLKPNKDWRKAYKAAIESGDKKQQSRALREAAMFARKQTEGTYMAEVINKHRDLRFNPKATEMKALVDFLLDNHIKKAASDLLSREKVKDFDPSEAQASAGNYPKLHKQMHGFQVSIENPAGSYRKGISPSGKAWKTLMHSDYGYLRGTKAIDGDHVDVFLNKTTAPSATVVHIIDQVNPNGTFDEHKCMLGWDTQDEASKAYLKNYEQGWTGLGAISTIPMKEFKKWVRSKDALKPYCGHSIKPKKEAKMNKEALLRRLLRKQDGTGPLGQIGLCDPSESKPLNKADGTGPRKDQTGPRGDTDECTESDKPKKKKASMNIAQSIVEKRAYDQQTMDALSGMSPEGIRDQKRNSWGAGAKSGLSSGMLSALLTTVMNKGVHPATGYAAGAGGLAGLLFGGLGQRGENQELEALAKYVEGGRQGNKPITATQPHSMEWTQRQADENQDWVDAKAKQN